MQNKIVLIAIVFFTIVAQSYAQENVYAEASFIKEYYTLKIFQIPINIRSFSFYMGQVKEEKTIKSNWYMAVDCFQRLKT